MKRILFNLLKTVIFLLFLVFVLKNMDDVAVRYFLGFEWHVPLAIVMLLFSTIGVAGGVMASLAIIARQRREILGLKRELRSQARGVLPSVTATAESL